MYPLVILAHKRTLIIRPSHEKWLSQVRGLKSNLRAEFWHLCCYDLIMSEQNVLYLDLVFTLSSVESQLYDLSKYHILKSYSVH